MLREPHLPVTRLRLRFSPASPGRATAFTGSAWRGALGHALRQLSCRTGAPTCVACPHIFDCAYSLAFETPRPPGDTWLSTDTVPHPFGLVALPDAVGDQKLTLALYGSGSQFAPSLMQALEHAAAGGVGPDRVRYRLVAIEHEHPLGSGAWLPLAQGGDAPPTSSAWPSPSAQCRLRLLTPLRLRRRDRYVGPAEFHLDDLCSHLVRRIALLCRYYAQPIEADFAALSEVSAATPLLRASLRWCELSRFSARQARAVPIGGLLGEVTLAPPAPLWPYLWLGQFTQAGKGTALGLGYYQLEPA